MTTDGSCTFRGSAQRVHVSGRGSAALLEAEPFSHGTVELSPAQIGNSPRVVKLDHPKLLWPVRMNGPEEPFSLSIEFGSSIRIDVVGGATGDFRGEVAGSTACLEKKCPVVWFDDAATPKRIELVYDGPRPTRLTSKMPIAKAVIGTIRLENATGLLTCGHDETQVRNKDWVWSGAALTLNEVRIEDGGLGVDIVGADPPHAPESGLPRVVVGLVVAIAVIVVAALVTRAIRRRSVSTSAAAARPVIAFPAEPTGADWSVLADAIESATSSEAALEAMLLRRLGKRLESFTALAPLPDMALKVATAARAGGWVDDLILALYDHAPKNPQVAEAVRRFSVAAASPPPAQPSPP